VAQVPRAGSIEEKVARLQALLAEADPEEIAVYHRMLDMSWIYHDSALEGIVYSSAELKVALDDQVVSDSSLLPTYDEIRQHRAAIALVRELADKKRQSIDVEVLKKLYAVLAPDDVDMNKGKVVFRKDMPVHRVYFHEIATPDKIAPQLQALFKWMADEKKAKTHPVRLAAKAHLRVLQVFPFPKHNGKVARLFMNLLLARAGFPPAIVHATERQRYYDALKVGENAVATLIHEALVSSIESSIRYFTSQAQAAAG
jgi:Fic family protein